MLADPERHKGEAVCLRKERDYHPVTQSRETPARAPPTALEKDIAALLCQRLRCSCGHPAHHEHRSVCGADMRPGTEHVPGSQVPPGSPAEGVCPAVQGQAAARAAGPYDRLPARKTPLPEVPCPGAPWQLHGLLWLTPGASRCLLIPHWGAVAPLYSPSLTATAL